MKITLTGAAAVVTAMALLLYSFHTLSILHYALALAIITLIFYDYRQTVKATSVLYRLEAERIVKPRYIEEQGIVTVTLRLWNPTDNGVPLLRLTDNLPVFADPVTDTVYDTNLPPKIGIEIVYRARLTAPGRHVWRSVIVRVSGPLGMFVSEHVVEAIDHVIALPRRPRIEVLAKTVERLPGLRLHGRALQGQYDLATIREYVPGDDARRILWRHYARTRKLYVREDYGEARARILLLLDANQDYWLLGKEPNTLAHLVLRLSRAVIEDVIESGGRVDVIVCGEEAPQLVMEITSINRHRIFDVYSAIESGKGCREGLSAFARFLANIPLHEYNALILVTALHGLATSGPRPLLEIASRINHGLHVVAAVYGVDEAMRLAPVLSGVERVVENLNGTLALFYHELLFVGRGEVEA